MRERYTAAQMIEAIQAAKGLKSVAARRLGCSWLTVHNYCKRHPTVQRAYEETREQLIDLAEAKLIDKVNKGVDWAIKWVLATLGKDRGWVERVEQEQVGEARIKVVREDTGIDSADEDAAFSSAADQAEQC